MELHNRKKRYIVVLIILLVISFLLFMSDQFKSYLTDPSLLKEFILSFGPVAPLAFILLQVLQSIFPMMPGQILIVVAGALFGVGMGSLYCLIGLSIGLTLVFFLSRRYGRSFVQKWIGIQQLRKFDEFIRQHHEVYAILLARLLPLFPNDVVSFGAGITRMKFKHYFFVSILALIPIVLSLSFVGAQFTAGISAKTIVITVLILTAFVLSFAYKHQIKTFLHNILVDIEIKLKIIKK